MKKFKFSTLAIVAILVLAISSQSFQCSRSKMLMELTQDSSSIGENTIRVLSSDEYEGRATGSEAEKKAAAFIIQTMKNIGLTPMGTSGGWTQTFTFVPHPPVKVHQVGDSTQLGMGLVKEISGNNVIGYMDNGAATTVVIGAHYDHLGWGDENSLSNDGKPAIHNGADDNASGVGAMLALAAKLKSSNLKNNNYLFIAFSGEEKGLWGSNFFCKNPTISNMNYMINLDMVGRLNAERALAISGVGTAPDWKVALDNANTFSFKNVYSESGVGPSDHTSFYNIGVPAIHLFTGQHADYHKPTDDADKINYAGVTDITNYLFNIVSQLNDKGKLTFQRTKDESQEAAASFKVTLGVIPDYLFGGEGMRIDGTREGKPAAKAGLKQGDIVIQLGDHKVTDMMSYMEALGKFEKGQTTVVRFIRDEKEQTANVTWE
jgi:Peptidase family M28/PDZ domain